MTDRLSSDMVHATTVAKDGRGVVIAGRSGAGKSDLALRLIDRGFVLVSDDQTLLSKIKGRLTASAPATIRGKLEVRGVGIVAMPTVETVPLCLWIELGDDILRLPEGESHGLLGLTLPKVGIDPRSASAPIKVELALDRLGLPA